MAKLKGYDVTKERTLVIMMLFHGTRIAETAKAKWKHIDLMHGVWRIPAANTKTNQAINIPLTSKAVALLKQWHKELFKVKKYRGEFLFPAAYRHQGNDRHVTSNVMHELIKKISEGNWTAHDTRKCCGDAWLELGYDSYIIEAQLNHSKGYVSKAYFQKEMMMRRLELLEGWQNFLTS